MTGETLTGRLFIKAPAGAVDADNNPVEWYDCWEQWGVGLDEGALDALMGFRPNKEPVVNKNVTAEGAYYVTGAGLVDERNVNIPFHIVAIDFADFLLKRNGFYQAIKSGLVTFKIEKPVQAIYKMYYVSCNQYTQFMDGIAKFMLSMYETNGFNDGDPASVEPMPITEDMEQYVIDLLNLYGRIATEEEVQGIIDHYFEEHPV